MRATLALLCMTVAGCFFELDDEGDGPPTGEPYCGDRIVNNAEQCDDGNSVAGDGCFQCQLEGGGDSAYVTASWTFRNEATSAMTGCPVGYDTVALYNQPVAPETGAPIGSPVIDLFDCAAGTGTTAPLSATTYSTWIEVVNTNNTSTYARSLETAVDVTTSDKSISVQILNDGGYFRLGWMLHGASSASPLTCVTANTASVEVVATDSVNSSNSASDSFNCLSTSGVTAGYVGATYTVVVSARSAADAELGSLTLTNRTIDAQNAVTNLGTVDIPIDGL